MNSESRGILWPLQLLFIITLGLGLFVFFDPQFEFQRRTACYLLGAALVTAVLLYLPRLWLMMRTPDFATVAATIDDTRAALTDVASGKEKLDLIRAEIAALQKQIDAIAAQFDAGGGVRTTLDTLTAKLDTTTAHLDAGGSVRQRLDAIAAQFDAGGGVRTTLDAIKAKVQ